MARASAAAASVKRLNKALVDEIVRVHLVRGRDHRQADLIAARIVELGGTPDYSSLRLTLRDRANPALGATTRA